MFGAYIYYSAIIPKKDLTSHKKSAKMTFWQFLYKYHLAYICTNMAKNNQRLKRMHNALKLQQL